MATYWENSCSFGLRYVSWYKCLIVSLVFSHLGFWSWNLFLIAPFPDLCLLVPHYPKLYNMAHLLAVFLLLPKDLTIIVILYVWMVGLNHFPGQAQTRAVNQLSESLCRSVL